MLGRLITTMDEMPRITDCGGNDYAQWPQPRLKELIVDHAGREKIALQLPPRKDYLGSNKIMRIADQMINQYSAGKRMKIERKFSPKIDYGNETGWFRLKNDIEPMKDFYDDYKTQRDPETFWNREFMGEFVTDNNAPYTRDKTYVKDVSYHPDRRRVEVDFETYRMHERNADYNMGFIEPPEISHRTNPADRTAFIRDTWNECAGYEEALRVGGRKYDLKKNLMVMIKTRAEPIYNAPQNERTAIDTLREMITEMEFRKYVKHGFVLVYANNGYTYQIFRNQAHTKVWKDGKVIKEVCVRLKSNTNIPPTDNVIAFKVMVEADPDSFEQLGNVYKMAEAA